MIKFVKDGNPNDKYFSSEQELAIYLQTGPKDVMIFVIEGEKPEYVISKELYEDLKVYGYTLDIYGRDYSVLMELANRMASYHGPIMKEICVTNPFDFLLFSVVTQEYFEDEILGKCVEGLKHVILDLEKSFKELHSVSEYGAYKASLRSSIFMSRVGMGNMRLQKKQAQNAGIVLPGTIPGNGGLMR